MTEASEVTRGSGNIYADLGIPNAEEHTAKAELARALLDEAWERDMNITQISALTGLPEVDLPDILRGRFRNYSLEQLSLALAHLTQR